MSHMHENAMTRGESHHTRRVPALALALSAALVLVATLALLPVSALAMTTNKATARPNEDGGSGVIGAMDTRLTWEGTVGDDEEVCLTHRATSRQIFVNGAISAAKRLLAREPGFYDYDTLMFG